MAIKKQLTVVQKYKDRNGEEKKRYINVGVIIDTRNGEMFKLESLPLGWDGWGYVNEPRERDDDQPRRAAQPAQQQARRPAAQPPSFGDDFTDDDIPF